MSPRKVEGSTVTSGSIAVEGSVEATPGVASSAETTFASSAASAGAVVRTATKNGPFTPGPKPSDIRS